MKKTELFLFSLLLVAAVVSCSKDPGGGTVPLLGPGPAANVTFANNGGNVTCDEVLAAVRLRCQNPTFTFANTSGKIDYYGGGGGTVGPITWTTDGTYINWTSTIPVKIAIIVKGGPTASVYFSGCGDYVQSGTALSAPVGPSGKPYGLSNITFCWNEEPMVVALKGWLSTPAGGLHFVSKGNTLFSDQTGYWCEALGYNVPGATFDVVLVNSPFNKIGTASITTAGVVTLNLNAGYVADFVRFFIGTAAELDQQGIDNEPPAGGWCPNYDLWTYKDY